MTYDRFSIIVKRDAKLLNWRVFANKQMDYHVFTSRQNGELRGYMVLRRPDPSELNMGTITDLYADKDDSDTIHDLVNHAISFFGKSVCAIQCLTSVANLATVLKHIGFRKMRQYQPLVYFSDRSLVKKFADFSHFDCCFSFIDHDADQIRPL
jgi:hypothetical protein